MIKFTNTIICLIVLAFIYSCGSNQIEQNKQVENKSGEMLINVNKYMVKKDVELIKTYIKRRSWNLTESESGLWYGIYKHANGKMPKLGSKVTVSYKLELLDGSLCYSSDSLGLKTFIIGKGTVENGFDEGILLMHVGDAAHLILPPHLAFGLVGDQKCIPPRSIIVYDVALLKIEE